MTCHSLCCRGAAGPTSLQEFVLDVSMHFDRLSLRNIRGLLLCFQLLNMLQVLQDGCPVDLRDDKGLARHSSHVTPNASHVTRHTSHVTRHTSHVARHTSHVTRHTSHVTRHTLHVTRHTSHVTRHTPHVTRHTSHVTRHILQAIPCSLPLLKTSTCPS